MADFDQRVRLAAFDCLDHQRQLYGETLPRTVLAQGFELEGRRDTRAASVNSGEAER